jgi:hypothetical protein
MADHSHPLIELTRGRLLELVREPAIVFWVFGFPILLSIGLGIAFRERAPEVPVIAVVGAPALAASLDARPELDARALDGAEADEALRKNRVDVVLTLASETATAARYRFDPARARGIDRRVTDKSAFVSLSGFAYTDLRTGLEATVAWYRRTLRDNPGAIRRWPRIKAERST